MRFLDQFASTGLAGLVVDQRQHSKLGLAILNRGDDIRKSWKGNCAAVGHEAQARFVGECTLNTLISDLHVIRAPSEHIKDTKFGKLVAIMSALSTVTGLFE